MSKIFHMYLGLFLVGMLSMKHIEVCECVFVCGCVWGKRRKGWGELMNSVNYLGFTY